MLSYAILNHSDAADFWEHPSEIMVFTCFYSEQSRPHNIKHPHMGTLRKGFNGGFFFDVFFWGGSEFPVKFPSNIGEVDIYSLQWAN